MSINKVILIGNVGKDPELKTTQTGTTFCLFSVATDETFKNRGGDAQKRTEWHSVIAWGKIADICSEYVAVGKPVYVEGSIQTRKWTDREGAERTSHQILARHVQVLSPAPTGTGMASPQNQARGQKQAEGMPMRIPWAGPRAGTCRQKTFPSERPDKPHATQQVQVRFYSSP
ncbi:MAG: single-stranded DNA-binding protein [Candidatus Acidiferrales bacterium]